VPNSLLDTANNGGADPYELASSQARVSLVQQSEASGLPQARFHLPPGTAENSTLRRTGNETSQYENSSLHAPSLPHQANMMK
jgi:hypothetical protein